jgi:L-rhamnose mutarotase
MHVSSCRKWWKTSHDLQVANEQVLAKEAQAKGEHRSMWPQMDYALQYAALARYNNYDVYFRRETFQRITSRWAWW